MTIDEAITQEREKAKIHRFNSCHVDAELYADDPEEIENAKERCIKCAEEHEQLAVWLEELKAYRKIGTVEECKESVLDIEKAYNKAIDDFVKALCIEYAPISDKMQKEYENVCLRFEKIAEQLKAGGQNE